MPSSSDPIQKKIRISGWIIFVLILLNSCAISRAFDAFEKDRRKSNLESGVYYVSCSIDECPNGAPLYDSIRMTQLVIGFIPIGEKCQVDAWYDAGQAKATLEAEFSEQYISEPFYYVECPSGEGWISAKYRGF